MNEPVETIKEHKERTKHHSFSWWYCYNCYVCDQCGQRLKKDD